MALPSKHACVVTPFDPLDFKHICVFVYCALLLWLGLLSLGGLRLGMTLCCHLAMYRKMGTINGPRRKKTVRFDHKHHQTTQQTSKDSGFDTGSSIFTSNDDPIYLGDIKVLNIELKHKKNKIKN